MKVGSLVERVGSGRMDSETINNLNILLSQGYVLPSLGGVYTIRGFLHSSNGDGIYLEEIVNPKICTHEGFMEVAFHVSSFRELQPPMDISELIEECQTQTV